MEDVVAGHHGALGGGPFGVYALSFNGVTGNVSAPASVAGSSARFHEVWVTPPAGATAWAQNTIPILADGATGTADADYQLTYYGNSDSGSCRFHFNGWSNDWDCYTPLLLAGRPNLIGLGYDGGLLHKLYLNGALLANGSKTLPRPLNTTAGTLKYGESNFNEHGLCKMGGMRVFNTDRTVAQHQASMSSPLLPQAGLYAQYLLTEGNGLTSDDNSGNNRHLVLSSSAVAWALNN